MHDRFYNFLKTEYQDDEEKLLYVDIGQISSIIVADFKLGATAYFNIFFEKAEEILESCDSEVENLIVIGLFQDIQNIAGGEINYYSGFNDWLKPVSKSKWYSLIDFREGIDWRNSKNI